MAWSDTIASKIGFTSGQVLNYMENNWEEIQDWRGRRDYENMTDGQKSRLRSVYSSIVSELQNNGGVDNCGGVVFLARRYGVPADVAQDIIDDFENELCPLYAATLE